MVKISESVIKIVRKKEWKQLTHFNQKVTKVGGMSRCYIPVVNTPSGQQQTPNPAYFLQWNVETPYGSQQWDSES
jgi:hypothetical protein